MASTHSIAAFSACHHHFDAARAAADFTKITDDFDELPWPTTFLAALINYMGSSYRRRATASIMAPFAAIASSTRASTSLLMLLPAFRDIAHDIFHILLYFLSRFRRRDTLAASPRRDRLGHRPHAAAPAPLAPRQPATALYAAGRVPAASASGLKRQVKRNAFKPAITVTLIHIHDDNGLISRARLP